MEEEVVIVYPREINRWELVDGIEKYLKETFSEKIFIKKSFQIPQRKKRYEEDGGSIKK